MIPSSAAQESQRRPPPVAATSVPPRLSEFRVEGLPSYAYRSTLGWLWSHNRHSPWVMLVGILGVILTTARNVGTPVVVGLAVAEVTSEDGSWDGLVRWAIVLIAINVAGNLADVVGAYSFSVLGARVQKEAREELTVSLLGKSQTFHNRQRIGDLMARATNDIRTLWNIYDPGASIFLDNLLTLVFSTAAIALIDPQLLLGPGVFILLGGVTLAIYSRQLNPLVIEQREVFGRTNATLNEAVSGIETVKASAQESQEADKFFRGATSVRNVAVAVGQLQARYYPLLVLAVATAIGSTQAFWLYSRGDLSVGGLTAFIGLMLTYRFPAEISIWTISMVQQGMAGARRIIELIQTTTELDERPDGHVARVEGEIVFENVSFGYGGRPVLEDLSLRIAPGQTVAIVGQTGSGKSTLTKLVNRTYDATAGRILVDGVDVREWNLDSLRAQIGEIEQDIFLFSRSVRDNIAFGAPPGTTEEEILAAARGAQADGFVRNFKDGYETEVGERGVSLSGGQRQRLAIARALLTDPRILVLDDATSAIDSATEDEIQLALQQVQRGRTTLMITHRLSQIRWADQIVVLDGGRLIDQGSHEELMDRCGIYTRIFSRYDAAA